MIAQLTSAGVRHDVFSGASRLDTSVRRWSTSADAHVTPLVVASFVVLAAICISLAVLSLVVRRNDDLDEMLKPYRLVSSGRQAEDGPRGLRPAAAQLGERLLRLADVRGFVPALEMRIQRSGMPVTAGECCVVELVAVVVLGILGFLAGHVAGAAFGLFIGGLGPPSYLQLRIDRRQRAFGEQLPDVLKLLASSLRAGFSLLQCLGAVTAQSVDPMHGELEAALARIRLGEPVEDALESVAERLGSRDFHWTVMAIRIQREVGGNLAEILDTVAETMVERSRIRREVRTLTAEGRASAIILAALPVCLAMFIFVANKPYLEIMLLSTSGQIALLVGLIMELVGGWWMHRVIQVEV